MREGIIVATAGLALCVCGGSGGSGNGSALDQTLTGDWSGTTTLTLSGLAPYTYQSTVSISMSGSTANINRAYFDYHSGSVVLNRDNTLHIDGSGLSYGCGGTVGRSALVMFDGSK